MQPIFEHRIPEFESKLNQKLVVCDTGKFVNPSVPQFFSSIKLDIARTNRELVMDREAWRDAIHGVAKSRTRLSD